MTSAEHSKAMILLLLIHFIVVPIVLWGIMFDPCFVAQYLVSFLALVLQ